MEKDPTQSFKDVINIKHVLGYRTDFRNNIILNIDGSSIIYPAGNVIVIENNENKPQKFIHCDPGTRGISAMAISPSKRFLAFAEISEPPLIVMYDLKTEKRVKTLVSMDVKSSSYVSLDFSRTQEHKHLIALSSAPDYSLVYFDWNKQKQITAMPIKVAQENQKFTHCFYHPKEDDFVMVLGTGAIKPFKLSLDGPPKPFTLAKKELKELQHSPNYLSYCILKDNSMIIGTDFGELLFFNSNGEFKTILSTSPKQEQFAIQCLIPYSKGFLVGGQDCTVLIYEKHEEHKNPYIRIDKRIQNQKREFRYPINSLMLLTNEENLIIGLENKQILQVPFTSDRVISEENLKFEHIGLPYHSERITGLDICIRKTLVATCSTDRTVRIWNYMEHTLETQKEFEEGAFAIAFHPSGFHIIVAFVDKIRLMNLFEHDIIPFKEYPAKNCREISISNGGHLFALNNNQIIQVYQFYTGEQYMTKKVSSGSQGKVRTIFWDEDDQGFYTGSSDGQVFYWFMEENSQSEKFEVFSKAGYAISSVSACNQNNERYIYISGATPNATDNEKCIFQVKLVIEKEKESGTGATKRITKSDPIRIETQANISQVRLLNSNKMILLSTEEADKPGAIRVCKTFFMVDPKDLQVVEIQSHFSPITRLRISFDDTYIFSAGEDGTLIIYQITLDRDSKIKLDKDGMGIAPAEEFLMQRQQYLEEIQEISKLQHHIQTLKFRQEQMAREEEKRREDKIRELRKQFNEVEDAEKRKYQDLLGAQEKMRQEFEDKKKKLKDQHEENKRKLEQDQKKKIALEMSRNENLQQEKESEYHRFQQEMDNLEKEHKRLMDEKGEKYKKMLEKEKYEFERLHKDRDEMVNNFNLDRDHLERDAETKIEYLKETNERQMKRLFQDLDTAQSQKITKKSEYETGQQQLEEQRSKLKEIMEQITHISEQNKQLKKETESHKKEILEREKTLADKQRRIYELKKKTQELEKFKFVLDYKIKELKRDIGPKEEEIAKMKEQIANMHSEILHFKRTNANLSLIVTDLKLRQTGMVREIKNNKGILEKNNSYIRAYEQDIAESYQEVGDYKKLKKCVLDLYNKYVVTDEKVNVDVSERKDNKDFINERAYLESTVQNLKKKFKNNMAVHEADNVRIMNQNVDLISEINDLKRERKNLKDDKNRNEDDVKIAKKKKDLLPEIQKLDDDIERNEDEKAKLAEEINELKELNQELKQKFQSLQSRPPQQQHQQQQQFQPQEQDQQEIMQD